jgi:hypothetical protein
MEETKPFIIPTRGKGKISHLLSFPIGAKQISIALASSRQLPYLELYFYPEFFNSVRDSSRYLILRVMYSRSAKPAVVDLLSDFPFRSGWQIGVHPVPRVFRNRIRQYIFDSALPEVNRWLNERAHLVQEGSDILRFYYDEKKEEFVVEHETHLQPLRH